MTHTDTHKRAHSSSGLSTDKQTKSTLRMDCKAKKRGTERERDRAETKAPRQKKGERFGLGGEKFSRFCSQSIRGITSRVASNQHLNGPRYLKVTHLPRHTHTQMKLDSSVRDRGHRTISRDVQFQHAVSLSLKFALFSFTLECSSYKQCQQPSKDRQQKRLLRSLLLPHFGSSSLHSVFIDYLRSSVKGLTGYLCEH